MEFQRLQYCHYFILFSVLYYGSQAYVFYAGGRDGWVLNPSEEYNHWVERNRFQVNDTIVFKYKKGSNSVLVVNKEGYDKCNKTNPIKKFEDGDSVFKFDRSGPFYFISGTDDYCEKGQKSIVVVLAIRLPPPSSVSPSPVSQPPLANQPSPAVSPYPSPKISRSSLPSPAVSPYPSPKISPSSPPSPAVSPYPSPKISPSSSPSPAVFAGTGQCAFLPNTGVCSGSGKDITHTVPCQYSSSLSNVVIAVSCVITTQTSGEHSVICSGVIGNTFGKPPGVVE